MSNFNLDDYVEVNVRVEKFWEKYPDGSINTEIVKWEGDIIAVRTEVYRDKEEINPASTGHAYEKIGSSFINKTSALENCETSSVGRALAILGFEVKKSIASKEEVANAILQQEEIKNKKDDKKTAPVTPKVKDNDLELKKALLEKHKGNKAAAKREYEELKAIENHVEGSEVA